MKTKHQLKCGEDLWKLVLKFKIDNDFRNNNDTVLELIRKGLEK